MVTPPRLEVFDAFLRQEFDVCWVFSPWEGVIAEHRGVDLNTFRLTDYQVPYGYSPLLMTREEILQEHPDQIRALLAAIARGYQEVSQQPDEAAKILSEGIKHLNFEDADLVSKTMTAIAPTLLTPPGRWGVMQPKHSEAIRAVAASAQFAGHRGGSVCIAARYHRRSAFHQSVLTVVRTTQTLSDTNSY